MLPSLHEIDCKLEEISNARKQAKEFDEEYKQNLCVDGDWHLDDIIDALKECYPDESFYSDLTAEKYQRYIKDDDADNEEKFLTNSLDAHEIFNELVREELIDFRVEIAKIAYNLECEKMKNLLLERKVRDMKKEMTEVCAIINELRNGKVLENGENNTLQAKMIANQLYNQQNKNKK